MQQPIRLRTDVHESAKVQHRAHRARVLLPHLSHNQNPVAPVNIPLPTKIDENGWCTQQKWVQISGIQMVYPEPHKELRRRPQLFVVGIVHAHRLRGSQRPGKEGGGSGCVVHFLGPPVERLQARVLPILPQVVPFLAIL